MKLAEEYPFEGLEGLKQPDISIKLTVMLEKALNSINNLTRIIEKRLRFHRSMCEIYNMLSREEEEVDFKNLGLLYEEATSEVEKLMNEMSDEIKRLEEDLPFIKKLVNSIELTVSRVNLYKKIVEYDESKGKSKLSTLAKLLKNCKIDEINSLVEYLYDRIKRADRL